jgi:BRCA1-associated protein
MIIYFKDVDDHDYDSSPYEFYKLNLNILSNLYHKDLKILEDNYTPLILLDALEFNTQDNHESLNIPSFDPVEYPICTYCLARIQQKFSQIALVDQYNIHTKSFGNYNRCSVCELYSRNNRHGNLDSYNKSFQSNNTSIDSRINTTTHPSGILNQVCISCTIKENLWVCMICGHVGCGRYTFQHAHNHFIDYRHSFSLELATGRIWDYRSDSYINLEVDVNYGHNSSIDNVRLNHPPNIYSTPHSDKISLFEIPYQSSNFIDQINIETSHLNPNKNLDSLTLVKLDNLISYYENLLNSQLDDQKLFYEKRLAKASVSALEGKLNLDSLNEPSSQMENEFENISSIKIEISLLEKCYNEILNSIKENEENLRSTKKSIEHDANNLKDKEKSLHEIIHLKNSNSVAYEQIEDDLKNQLQDLKFYMTTQANVQVSPLREEIKSGDLYLVDRNPPQAASSVNNKSKHTKPKR